VNTRSSSFGQNYEQSMVDRVGIWLSTRRIARLVKRCRAQSVGDFGCGYNAELARQVRCSVDKVVIADVALNQELVDSPDFDTHVGILPGVLENIASHSLDLVIMNSVVEHLDNPVATLESIRNILSPGGVLFINVPSWLGKTLLEFLAFKLHLSPAEEMEDHRRYYSKRELWLELRAAGFTPSKIKIRRHKFLTNVYAIVEM
jgi:SAM-dependent methyltransferase